MAKIKESGMCKRNYKHSAIIRARHGRTQLESSTKRLSTSFIIAARMSQLIGGIAVPTLKFPHYSLAFAEQDSNSGHIPHSILFALPAAIICSYRRGRGEERERTTKGLIRPKCQESSPRGARPELGIAQ
ncbi:hypothetical protein H0E87_004253, partial [Populus deltoides]